MIFKAQHKVQTPEVSNAFFFFFLSISYFTTTIPNNTPRLFRAAPSRFPLRSVQVLQRLKKISGSVAGKRDE